MVFDVLAGVVLVVHLAFILFVAAGALLAWHWPWLVWSHVPAVAWGVGIIVIGYECPLTPLEKWLRRRGGDEGYEGGFIDHYIENVIYPEEYTLLLRALAAVMIVTGYVWLFRRKGRPAPGVNRGARGMTNGPHRLLRASTGTSGGARLEPCPARPRARIGDLLGARGYRAVSQKAGRESRLG